MISIVLCSTSYMRSTCNIYTQICVYSKRLAYSLSEPRHCPDLRWCRKAARESTERPMPGGYQVVFNGGAERPTVMSKTIPAIGDYPLKQARVVKQRSFVFVAVVHCL